MTTAHDNSTADSLESWLDRNTDLPRESLFADGQIVGDWQLLAPLGRGGSGEVWRARNRTTGETAALKFLHRTTPEARARFLRECALIESIHLPGVSRFIAAGEVDGVPFLATEELADYPFPSDDDGVAALLLALIPALAALHRIGIIHRDIKPSNIMGRLDADGHVIPVLIDLGLLKHFDQKGRPTTDSISIMQNRVVGVGTPGYAAPEQFTGGDLSPATDIHALGMLANHCFRDSPPRAWIPIIRRASSSIPTQRFASVLDLAQAIRKRHRGRQVLRALGLAAALCALGTLAFGLVRTVALRDLHALDHVYVSATAAASGDGTAARPFATIAAGIKAVNPSGTVTVGPGTYDEPIVLNTKTVTLEAPAGFERTFVKGHWGGAAITVSDLATDSTISGFTFTGGAGHALTRYAFLRKHYGYECFGGGAYCSTAATFVKCRFLANGNAAAKDRSLRTCMGGGVLAYDAPVQLLNCVISNNYAEAAGGGLVAFGPNACVYMLGGHLVANRVGPTSLISPIQLGGLAVLENASVNLNGVTIFGNCGEQMGTLYLSTRDKALLNVEKCSVEGGARANGIPDFTADYKSRQDYRP